MSITYTREYLTRSRVDVSSDISIDQHVIEESNPFAALKHLMSNIDVVEYRSNQEMKLVFMDGTSQMCYPDHPQASYLALLLLLRSPFGCEQVHGGFEFAPEDQVKPFDGKMTVFTRPSAFFDDEETNSLNPFAADPSATERIGKITYFEGEGMLIDWSDPRMRPSSWYCYPNKPQKLDYILRLMLMNPFAGTCILGKLKDRGEIPYEWTYNELNSIVISHGDMPDVAEWLRVWLSPRAAAVWTKHDVKVVCRDVSVQTGV